MTCPRGLAALAVLGVVGGVACSGKPPPAEVDDILLGSGTTGSTVRVQGTMFALSYQASHHPTTGAATPLPGRYVLLAAGDDGSITAEQRQWGLGVHLPGDALATGRWVVPQTGATVIARGTLDTVTINDIERPVLTSVTSFRVVKDPGRPLAQVGDACERDSDCADRLWCSRTGVCAAMPALEWGSVTRNIYGSCTTDADCPAGQICDTGYTISAGNYGPAYFNGRDVGLHLCRVPPDATTHSVCPHPASVADLLGGRFPAGKEACFDATVLLTIVATDGDTHIQMTIPDPAIYPPSEPTLDPFGAAFENVPPYKDPANPAGPVTDPIYRTHVDILGTVHFDNSHAWFEVHPIKWWQPVP